jgi:hypothetical protein
VLVVADDRLNRIAAFEKFLQCASRIVPTGDMNFDIPRMMLFAAVAAINEGFFRSDAGQTLDLIDRRFERRTVIGIVVMSLDGDDPVTL